MTSQQYLQFTVVLASCLLVQSTDPSICPPIHPPTYSFLIHPALCVPIHPSMHPSMPPSIHVSFLPPSIPHLSIFFNHLLLFHLYDQLFSFLLFIIHSFPVCLPLVYSVRASERQDQCWVLENKSSAAVARAPEQLPAEEQHVV